MENTKLVTVIMPIYNVEDYIDEAINSIINQTIGFRENIELILVNDGSPDRCGEICKGYAEKYPENIKYIEKENGGVSSARNAGLAQATGKYVNFLDPDDYWNTDAFSHVFDFIKEHPDINIVTTRIVYFGRRGRFQRKHHLDYVFKTSRVVDIFEEYRSIVTMTSKSFILREIIGDLKFDEEVSYQEDVLFANRLILKEKKYGAVREAVYNYRKRNDSTSLVDTSLENPSSYITTPNHIYKGLMDYSVELYGEVIPYIQYLVITNIWRRISLSTDDMLPNNENRLEIIEESKKILFDILMSVDDEYVLKQKRIQPWLKAYIFNVKYGEEYNEDRKLQRRIARRIRMIAKLLYVENDELVIVGDAPEKYIGEGYSVFALDNRGNRYEMTYEDYPAYDKKGIFEGISFDGKIHKMRLPLEDHIKFYFYITDNRKFRKRMDFSLGDYSRLTSFKDSFFATKDYIIKQFDNKTIGVYNYHRKTHLASYVRYHKSLKEHADEDIIKLRKMAVKEKLSKKRPIWLISDRTDFGGDNGETFFRWLQNNNELDIDSYYVISKSSPDYDRMKQYGKILDFGSDEHLAKQIAADMIIESSGSYFTYNPYGLDFKYFRDLAEYKCVFLQHGIIIHDLSGWLHKLSTNFDMFVTSAPKEWDSIAHGNYGYTENEVRCTGLARYDLLEDKKKKIVAITPTWRRSIVPKVDGSSARVYSETFKESDYCKYFNRLINDERLIEVFEKHGYKGVFYLHPNHRMQAADFHGNDTISVCDLQVNYSDVFNESALLVTDYSSVAMDFAYLRKPIVYTQFDKDEIYSVQVYDEGYFDFERDGFGPVCEDYESTVSAIIKAVENDCEEPPEYLERVNNFFAYNDNNNCRRIYDEILMTDFWGKK